jgi:SAM-dependent methyltransferase
LVAKVIGPDERRRSRFHTERGDLMPLEGWATVLPSTWGHFTYRVAREPWMTRPAIRYLDRLIRRTWTVIEFGSGYSTVWLARRCATLTSLEDDPQWYDRAVELIAGEHCNNATLRLEPQTAFPGLIADWPDQSIDLVIVDCADRDGGASRLRCVDASIRKIRPGGYLVLDDSDRPAYREVDSMLQGWSARRFVGWKPLPLHATETTAYSKPNNDGAKAPTP